MIKTFKCVLRAIGDPDLAEMVVDYIMPDVTQCISITNIVAAGAMELLNVASFNFASDLYYDLTINGHHEEAAVVANLHDKKCPHKTPLRESHIHKLNASLTFAVEYNDLSDVRYYIHLGACSFGYALSLEPFDTQHKDKAIRGHVSKICCVGVYATAMIRS